MAVIVFIHSNSIWHERTNGRTKELKWREKKCHKNYFVDREQGSVLKFNGNDENRQNSLFFLWYSLMHCTSCVRIANSLAHSPAFQSLVACISMSTKTCSCCARAPTEQRNKQVPLSAYIAVVLCAKWNEIERTSGLARRALNRMSSRLSCLRSQKTHTHKHMNIIKIAKRTRRARRYYICFGIFFFSKSISRIWNIKFCIFRHCSRCRLLFFVIFSFEPSYFFQPKGALPFNVFALKIWLFSKRAKMSTSMMSLYWTEHTRPDPHTNAIIWAVLH